MAKNAGLLGKLAQKSATEETKGKKSETPIVEIEGSEKNKLAAEKLIAAKRTIKQAESTGSQQEEILLPVCKDARKKHCMEKQQFTSTVQVKVAGATELEPLSFQTQNRYSTIPITSQEPLETIFGDKMERCFQTITAIDVTDAGLKELEKEGSTLLDKIVTAVGGPDAFGKYFKVTQTLKPTDFLHEQSVQDAAIAALLDKAVKEQLVKPVKPSFRVA